MNSDKILHAYQELAESYSRLIEHKPHNAYYDRPNTLSMFPEDLQGKDILNAGCGPGKYAEILYSRGARVIGFDLSPKMVEHAIARNARPDAFFVHDMSAPLSMFSQGSFDFVLSALSLDYVENWELTIREFHRVLRPGGAVIMSLSHPFFDYNFFQSKYYFEVEDVSCVWKGFGTPVEVFSHRRSLTACMLPWTENGFYIDKVFEPKPTPEFEQLDPRHYKELNEFPSFLCMRVVRKS